MRAAARVASAAAAAAAYDMGPTFGEDYGGRDYNVTAWRSGPDRAADHYRASALECEAYCAADAGCCAWTAHCLAPRAVTGPDNATLSAACGGARPGVPYPGADFTHPKIHHSPDCLH
eukprot:gene2015-8186_t